MSFRHFYQFREKTVSSFFLSQSKLNERIQIFRMLSRNGGLVIHSDKNKCYPPPLLVLLYSSIKSVFWQNSLIKGTSYVFCPPFLNNISSFLNLSLSTFYIKLNCKLYVKYIICIKLSLSINPMIKASSEGTSELIKEMAIVVRFQFHLRSKQGF